MKSAKILGLLTQTGREVEFRDGIIAEIALANGISKILTRNADHFERIGELTVLSY